MEDMKDQRIAAFLTLDDGYGDGSGYGYGDGSLRYIKSFCGKLVYMIDDVPTIIDRITSGIAKGRILRNDMTTTPCS